MKSGVAAVPHSGDSDRQWRRVSVSFHWHLERLDIRHVYIRPRSPHLNGKVERSHRIDDQEFYQLLDQHGVTDDIHLFNEKLREWEDYYNYHRPHGALDGQTPTNGYSRRRELKCHRPLRDLQRNSAIFAGQLIPLWGTLPFFLPFLVTPLRRESTVLVRACPTNPLPSRGMRARDGHTGAISMDILHFVARVFVIPTARDCQWAATLIPEGWFRPCHSCDVRSPVLPTSPPDAQETVGSS